MNEENAHLQEASTDLRGAAAAGPAALEVEGISKSYGVVKALKPASLTLRQGEIHALVGENGSGKSTFVGVISGTVRPDSGTVRVGGTTLAHHSPAESQRRSVQTVFQDGSILPQLTIAQNLYLGTPTDQRPSYGRHEKWAAELLAEWELGRIDVAAAAESLSPGDRQSLEIVRAVAAEPRVLLFDEATSALDASGVDGALALMQRAAAAGSAVMFVTHRLSEVFRVAERISVLRDGEWQGTFGAGSVDADGLVELMAGTKVDTEFPPQASAEELGKVVLAAKGLAGPGFGPADLRVRAGEIVGIAGADDNGQVGFLRGLGRIGAPTGALSVAGESIASYKQAVGAGAAYLSSDRANESLFRALPIRENLAVGMLGQLSRLGLVSWRGERELVDETVNVFGIRLSSPEAPVTSLSGGNQQKVALGRVLATEPKVLLVEEPTQGVDVRSRVDIYNQLRDGARRGLGVVMVSSDASELAGLCDRVVVMSRGKLVAELATEEATEESIVNSFTALGHGAGQETLAAVAAGEEPAAAPVSARASAWDRFRAVLRRNENGPRLGLLGLLLVLIGLYAQSENDLFLSHANVYNLLFLAVPLAAIAAAEFAVLFVGQIDVSVGAVMAMMIVLMSVFVQSESFLVALLLSLLIALILGVIVGLGNATLVEGARISPIIATIGTLGIVGGIGLMIRPTAGGAISPDLLEALAEEVWVLPWTFVVLAVLFALGDWALRSTGTGLRLRSVGLNAAFAHRLGVNARLVRTGAFVVAAVFAACAGLLLSAQIGIGDATVGQGYLLLAIAAPVLGGASLAGGHGTFIGCLLGACLLVTVQNLTTLLGIKDAYSYLLTGGLTVVALLLYTSGAGAAIRNYVRSLRLRFGAAGTAEEGAS
ncbi:MAG TPA: ATP-binding cassette domain-containing protein [Solirubrobacterales bacterium]|nr:ATP-binding cassette domain-containing protein [Solirubrobacterales bacterium]